MLRSIMKTSIARTLHAVRGERLLGSAAKQRHLPLILCYHRVVEDFQESARHSIPAMLVGTDTFSRHLDWIGRHYDFATLDEVLVEHKRLQQEQSPRRRPLAAITFDDGYADVLHNAVPIMNRKGVPSTMFVVTSLVGSNDFQMHDELYLLCSNLLQQDDQKRRSAAEDFIAQVSIDSNRAVTLRQRFEGQDAYRLTRSLLELLSDHELEHAMQWLRTRVAIRCDASDAFRALSWDEIRTMQQQGVTIGSHTRSHALLPGLPVQTMEDEVKESRRVLEQQLAAPVRHFAYPDGRFCSEAIQAVADAEYHGAYTICTHRDERNPNFTIPRKVFWEHTCSDHRGRFSPAILSCQVNGIFDPARLCTHEHGRL